MKWTRRNLVISFCLGVQIHKQNDILYLNEALRHRFFVRIDQGLHTRWTTIIGDVVDWESPVLGPYGLLTLFGKMRSGKANIAIDSYSLETKNTGWAFSLALGRSGYKSISDDETLPSRYLLSCSVEAATDLFSLISRLEAPTIHISMEISEQLYRKKWTKEQMREISLERINSFTEFVRKYPKERDLCGYARLYELSLRLIWTDDFKGTLAFVNSLLKDYADTPRISIMALWYKALLLQWYEPKSAQLVFQTLAIRYKKHDWWVVRAAGVIAKAPLPPIKDGPFTISEPVTYDPVAQQRIFHNILVFFIRKRLV